MLHCERNNADKVESMSEEQKIHVVIADDQELVRAGFAMVIGSQPDMAVAAQARDGAEALALAETLHPDVVLMDVRMPNMSGVDCTRIVKKEYPNIKVIILTTFDDDEYIYDALKYGASGYLLKGCSLEELSSAIHSVLSGGACFNPNVAGKVAQFFSQMANSNSEFSLEHEEDFDLSDTERQIIAQIGHGYSNKEIAQKLGFSEGTIRNYLSVILDKLDLRDRTQLAIWYLSRGNK